jgi:hypothetical protein
VGNWCSELLSEIHPWKDGVEGIEAGHLWDCTMSALMALKAAEYRVGYIDTAHRNPGGDLVVGRQLLHRIASIRPEISHHDMPPLHNPVLDS